MSRRSYGRITGTRRMKRNHVLLAKHKFCQACFTRPSTQVDHIVPLHDGGTEAISNLQCLCARCHLNKTKRELSRARRASFVDDMASPKGARVIRRPR